MNDAYWQKFCKIIKEHGHAVQAVFPDIDAQKPGFSYTVGLSQNPKRFEVIAFALPPAIAHAILNGVAETVNAGTAIPFNEVIPPQSFQYPDSVNTWASAPVMLRACVPALARQYAFGAYRWAEERGSAFTLVQLVLPDKQWRFPEDPDFDHEMLLRQPVLYKQEKP